MSINNDSARNQNEKLTIVAPGFHTIEPDTRLNRESTQPNSNEIKIDPKAPITIPNIGVPIKSTYRPTILGTCFIITHVSLGNFAIFSYAQKTKSFGLVWMIIFCILVAIINYWAIMRSFAASTKIKDMNYFQITEHFLGKKARRFLNVFIIGYAFLYMMYLVALTFPMTGRIVKILLYNKQYQSYDTFYKEKWGRGFIKYPFFITIGFCSYVINYFKFIRLKTIGIFRIITIIFCILILIIQTPSYYNYYKSNIYNEKDETTYPNWSNLGNAFTTKMEFFKGLCILFVSYTCMSVMFPIFEGFKIQLNPWKNVRISVILGLLSTTAITITSIICSYLMNPYSPEELIIFRKNKNSGKDIVMLIINFILIICAVFTVSRYYLMLKINFKILFFSNKEKLLEKLNNLFTFIFCFGSALASVHFNHFLSYLSYIGGFFSVFISFLFPVLLYVKSTGKDIKYWNNLSQIIFAIILCVIGIIGGISTFVDDIRN